MSIADQLKLEGRTENLRDNIVRVLRTRFGEVPAELLDRVQTADVATLDVWFDRALKAESPEQVFTART